MRWRAGPRPGRRHGTLTCGSRSSIEAAEKKAFATAIDWPGWSRSGKTEELAIEALLAYADRYAAVAGLPARRSPTGAVSTSRSSSASGGGGGTEFGVPSTVTKHDARKVTAAEADAWRAWSRRRGGRSTESAAGGTGGAPEGAARRRPEHLEGDRARRRIGRCLRTGDGREDPGAGPVGQEGGQGDAQRDARRSCGRLRDGSPIAGRRWPPRYAAHRIAWHALDHAWEIEDRSEPAD